MHREMRRKERQLSEAEAYSLLETCEYGVLSSVCADGSPYGVPISYALEKKSLYMHSTNKGGLKLENIALSPKACFTVIGKTLVLPEIFSTLYQSAICFGTCCIVESEEEKRFGLELLLRKYSANYIQEGMGAIARSLNKVHVLRFDIEFITGKGRKPTS